MGRQILFRAGDRDLAELEAAFRAAGAQFLAYYHASGQLSIVKSLDRSEVYERIIWLVREEDLHAVRLKYVPAQGYWLVDQLRSPVVELTRGTATGRGRLHFNTSYYSENDSRQEFPPGFVEWAAGFLGLIRRKFRRDPASGVYVGPSAPPLAAEPS